MLSHKNDTVVPWKIQFMRALRAASLPPQETQRVEGNDLAGERAAGSGAWQLKKTQSRFPHGEVVVQKLPPLPLSGMSLYICICILLICLSLGKKCATLRPASSILRGSSRSSNVMQRAKGYRMFFLEI